MTTLQIMICIIFSLCIGAGIMKIIQIKKDKTAEEKQKEEMVTNVIIAIIKTALELTTIESEDDLEEYCISKAQENVKKLGYDDITDTDVSIAVKLVLKSMEDTLNKKFKSN